MKTHFNTKTHYKEIGYVLSIKEVALSGYKVRFHQYIETKHSIF